MTSSSIENTERLEALSVCGGVDYSEKSDLDLVNLMCDGDGDAFVEIVSRYETKLIAYSRRYVGSLDLAKDICQEGPCLRRRRGTPSRRGCLQRRFREQFRCRGLPRRGRKRTRRCCKRISYQWG